MLEKDAKNAFAFAFHEHDVAEPCSIQRLCDLLEDSRMHQRFTQLIVVGSPVDIAWVHASLPPEVARMIVAEVRYPLLNAWFGDAEGMRQLKHALSTVVTT